MTGVGAYREDAHTGFVGQNRGPLVRTSGVQGRLSQFEVLGAVVVHDQQPVAGWFDVILDTLPARRHNSWLALRLIGAEQPILRGQLAGGAQNDPAIVSAGVNSDPEPLVRFDEHFDVVCGVGAAGPRMAARLRPPGYRTRDCSAPRWPRSRCRGFRRPATPRSEDP